MRVQLISQGNQVIQLLSILKRQPNLQFEEPAKTDNREWNELYNSLQSLQEDIQKATEDTAVFIKSGKDGPANDNSIQEQSYQDKADPRDDLESVRTLLHDFRDSLHSDQVKLNKIQNKIDDLSEKRSILELLERIDIPFEQLSEIKYLALHIGWIPTLEYGHMDVPVLRTPLLILPLLEDNGKLLVAGLTDSRYAGILTRILHSLMYTPLVINSLDRTVKNSNNILKRLERLQAAKSGLERDKKEKASKWQDKLATAHRQIEQDASIIHTLMYFSSSDRDAGFYYFIFRIPEKNLKTMLSEVESAVGHGYSIITYPVESPLEVNR